MWKKIVIPVGAISFLAVSGFFYWQNQKDVRELNKTLPKGLAVVKSLFGREYKVVNKIDGYSFKVPKEWKGVKKMIYTSERTERGYIGTSLEIRGENSIDQSVGIDRFRGENGIKLEDWSKTFFEKLGLIGEFVKSKIKEMEIIKTQESIHLMGDYVYFLKKNSAVYTITGPSEEFIKEIISDGNW